MDVWQREAIGETEKDAVGESLPELAAENDADAVRHALRVGVAVVEPHCDGVADEQTEGERNVADDVADAVDDAVDDAVALAPEGDGESEPEGEPVCEPDPVVDAVVDGREVADPEREPLTVADALLLVLADVELETLYESEAVPETVVVGERDADGQRDAGADCVLENDTVGEMDGLAVDAIDAETLGVAVVLPEDVDI